MTIKCASEKWKEVFILNDLSFEKIPESCKSKKDIPIVIAKNVLKYPEQVREFLENGHWWMNRCANSNIRPGKSIDFGFDVEKYFNPMIKQFTKFYNADSIEPIEFYGNCYNGNADLYTTMSYLPHVDTFPGADEDINPLNDYAFNLNLTKSDKVKTAFYSFNGKKSVCDWTPDDYDDFYRVRDRHKKIKAKDWRKLSNENFQNYQLEYIANIEYNSLILYPSHYWHSVYIKEDWFTDTDRITFTGFFETQTTSSKTKKLGFG